MDCCSDCGSDGLDSCCCWSPFCAVSSLAGPLLSFFPFASRTDSCQSVSQDRVCTVYSVLLSTRHMITSAYIEVRRTHARIYSEYTHTAYSVLRTETAENSGEKKRKVIRTMAIPTSPHAPDLVFSKRLSFVALCGERFPVMY